jgi:oligopeptide transport system substrate-binding protein
VINFHYLFSWLARLVLTALLLSALTLAGCGDSGPQSTYESVLRRGNGAEPESLDAHKVASTEAGDVMRDLGEGLLGFAPDGELRAAAAESWVVSDDGLEYTFRLRPTARWSNGEPVIAEDFVYSFRRLVSPATAAIYIDSVADIEHAEEIVAGELRADTLGVFATGQHELTIRLKRVVPYFLSLLTHPSTFPLHRVSIETYGAAHARAGNLVSNGAYKLTDREIASYIELTRNQYYWNNAETKIDRVMYYVTAQPMAELNRFRAGELDTTRTIPPQSFAQMQQERPGQVRTSPSFAVYYFGFNMTKAKFADNPKLRQALSMAIDRETIAVELVGRGEKAAYGWVPDGAINYEPQQFSYADLPKQERHQQARQLYREAGFGPDSPLTIELRYNTSTAHQRIAAAVQAMWKEVLGVETTLVNEQQLVLLATIAQKDVTEVFRSSWSGEFNDAYTFLSMLESDNPSNLMAYQNPVYDSLMDKAATQTDPDPRRDLLAEAERLLLNDHPFIPIYFYVNKSMVSKRVQGWGDNVLNYHYSQHLRLAAEE